MIVLRHQQKGSALAIALLVLSLVTALVYYTQQSHWRFQRLEQLMLASEKSSQYLYSSELMAAKLLDEDAQQNNIDHLKEVWAQQKQSFALENGRISLSLEDALAKFNLNSLAKLAKPNSQNPLQRFSSQQKRFIRLLQSFEEPQLTEAEAIEVVEAIIDWLDKDENPTGFGGFESIQYLGLSNLNQALPGSYQSANRYFTDASELRLIHNITPQLYQLLIPLVTALPSEWDFNINTSHPQLLYSLNTSDSLSPLDAQQQQDLMQRRLQGPFKTLQALKNQDSSLAIETDGLQIASQFFILHSRIELGQRINLSRSLLLRENGEVKVLSRYLNHDYETTL